MNKAPGLEDANVTRGSQLRSTAPNDRDLTLMGRDVLMKEDSSLSLLNSVEKETEDPTASKRRTLGQFGQPAGEEEVDDADCQAAKPHSDKQSKVEAFLVSKKEDVGALHPQESYTKKVFQSKPGRLLKPLGLTLQVGGGIAGISGIGLAALGLVGGIFLAIPGLIVAGAGRGGYVLGKKLSEEAHDRRKDDANNLRSRITQLPEFSPERIKLSEKISDWLYGRKSESFQRIRFEVLEQEIKHSEVIDKEAKISLLKKFTGKQATNSRYRVLFNHFIETKRAYQAATDLKKLLPNQNKATLASVIKAAKETYTGPRWQLNLAKKADREEFFSKLIDYIHENPKRHADEQLEIIEKGLSGGLSPSAIWEKLISTISEESSESTRREEKIDFTERGTEVDHETGNTILYTTILGRQGDGL